MKTGILATLLVNAALLMFRPIPPVHGAQPSAGRPSYEETTSFIKTFFASAAIKDDLNDRFSYSFGPKDTYVQIHRYKIVDLSFSSGCTMHIKYEVTVSTAGSSSDGVRTIFDRSIDLSRVESVAVERNCVGFARSCEEPQTAVYGIRFHVKGSPDQKWVDLPLAKAAFEGEPDKNVEKLEATKIFKAFNHLRKLCNAPEPIDFD